MQHDFRVGETVTRYGDDRCEVVELVSDDILRAVCRVAGRYLAVGEEELHLASRFSRPRP